MADYIEREAVIKICSNQYKECLRKNDWCGDTVAWNIGFAVKDIPAADVLEVKCGRWVEWWPPKHMILTGEEKLFRCSICDAKYADVEGFSFCPYCGADMREEGHHAPD